MNESGRRFRSEWIIPPKLPDEGLLERLRDACRLRPRIAEAWLVGTRMIPVDGSRPWEASLIGLLDPSHEPGRDDSLTLYSELAEATGWGGAADEGWRMLTPTEVSEHADDVVRLYSRGSTMIG
jgi:hypothetical protein